MCVYVFVCVCVRACVDVRVCVSRRSPPIPFRRMQAFLSFIKIIDYSVLVGVDEERRELVVRVFVCVCGVCLCACVECRAN